LYDGDHPVGNFASFDVLGTAFELFSFGVFPLVQILRPFTVGQRLGIKKPVNHRSSGDSRSRVRWGLLSR
jgi:hypothetical protein